MKTIKIEITQEVFEVGDVLDLRDVLVGTHKETLKKAKRGVVIRARELVRGAYSYFVATDIGTSTIMTAEQSKNAKYIGHVDLDVLFACGE